jgi:adenylate cyclase class IV
MHEMNTLYDTPDGALARRGQVLRIRVERQVGGPRKGGSRQEFRKREEAVTVTYKGPIESGPAEDLKKAASAKTAHALGAGPQRGPLHGEPNQKQGPNRYPNRYKIRDEREVRVADARASGHILEAFGLAAQFRYEKYRTTYRLPRRAGTVEVDLDETPIGNFLELEGSRRAIDRAAKWLGFGPGDYIVESYVALYGRQFAASGRESSQNETGRWLSLPDMLFRSAASKRRSKQKPANHG